MTLGFPTIVIPTLQGGEPRETLVLSQTEVSWISKFNYTYLLIIFTVINVTFTYFKLFYNAIL